MLPSKNPTGPGSVPVIERSRATAKEKIANGAKFERDKDAPPGLVCAACQGHGENGPALDKTTGLGPACWMNWRWSAIAEYELR